VCGRPDWVQPPSEPCESGAATGTACGGRKQVVRGRQPVEGGGRSKPSQRSHTAHAPPTTTAASSPLAQAPRCCRRTPGSGTRRRSQSRPWRTCWVMVSLLLPSSGPNATATSREVSVTCPSRGACSVPGPVAAVRGGCHCLHPLLHVVCALLHLVWLWRRPRPWPVGCLFLAGLHRKERLCSPRAPCRLARPTPLPRRFCIGMAASCISAVLL
jgi:hypothetical protein